MNPTLVSLLNVAATLFLAWFVFVGLASAAIAGPREFVCALAFFGLAIGGAVWNSVDVKRAKATAEAASTIPITWLNKVFEEESFVPREELLGVVDTDTTWALARLHEAGVPANYNATHWDNDVPLDAVTIAAEVRQDVAS